MNITQALQDHLFRIGTADWLEIGTDQGSEQTALLSDSCATRLYSVDIDPLRIDRNRAYYNSRSNIEFVCRDGLQFIQQHQGQFSLVFLDNFDWDNSAKHAYDAKPTHIQQQIVRYTQLNMSMNNLQSQAVHLAQCMAIQPLLTDHSIIIIDDTFFNHDHVYSGKGGACVPYLISQGYCYQEYDMGLVFWRE